MIPTTFKELVFDLKQRRVAGDPPPVVLLGAGASVDAGIGAMPDLYKFLDCKDFDEFSKKIENWSNRQRYRYLSDFLRTRDDARITPGYQALALLCAERYFDIILTTNLDPLLEDALSVVGLKRKDYLMFVNGVVQAKADLQAKFGFDLEQLLRATFPSVKIFKLHGDLFHRFMAWTPEEMDALLTEATPTLAPVLQGRDVLVVGHSLRDARIRELATQTEGEVWFTHPAEVPDYLKDNASVRGVVSVECKFETLFPELAKAVGLKMPLTGSAGGRPLGMTGAQAARKRTLDDLVASVVGVAEVGQESGATGFLVAEPRCIVADAYAVPSAPGATVEVILADKTRHSARVLYREESHPFGPVLLEAPDALLAPGLLLAKSAPRPGTAVSICVMAGERTGLSSGKITDAAEKTYEIGGVGRVSSLADVQAVVAPGSSGGPVVDANFAVLGYIVAGAEDKPPSVLYPTAHWAGVLKKVPVS